MGLSYHLLTSIIGDSSMKEQKGGQTGQKDTGKISYTWGCSRKNGPRYTRKLRG